ncbi:hypothetical protein [Nocardia sp. N2S4-5]|uniref:hypothetical protein n=1 Tax=Nocardia sp. N2S4-5 TaxID=3351565 RepID=UPI0037D58F6E
MGTKMSTPDPNPQYVPPVYNPQSAAPNSTPDAARVVKAVNRAEAQIVNRHNVSLAGCKVDGPLFRIGSRAYPINTVSAEMELGASSSTGRMTATRLVAGAAIAGIPGMMVGGAAKKRTDTTRVYLTIRAPDGRVEVRDVSAKKEAAARNFMARLEMATQRQWPLTSSVGTVLPLDASSVRYDPRGMFMTSTIAVGVLLLVWGLAVHPVLIAFTVFAIAALVFFVVSGKRDAEALAHHRRSRGLV